MHVDTLEVLPVGDGGDLFQICDGELYGHLEIAGADMPWDELLERITIHPEIITYLRAWLTGNGVLVGSRHPPRIMWNEMRAQVPAARFI